MDKFDETLEKKIVRLEKWIIRLQKEMWWLKSVAQRNDTWKRIVPTPRQAKKASQLDLFQRAE